MEENDIESKFEGVFDQILKIMDGSERCIVVLDDDPTGCQTLHGIPVLFHWDLDTLVQEFRVGTPLFFLMTNSRSMEERDAVALNIETGQLIQEASKRTGRKFSVISRSDSTLRGHYPAEPDALQFLYKHPPVHCIIPAFFQGHRYTIGDEHFVKTGNIMVPASQTPFAKDKIFGFTQSNLKKWVEEKTHGRTTQNEVFSFSLENLRTKGPDYVHGTLKELNPGSVLIVNAARQNDLDIFALGALQAEENGTDLLYRTAASFLNSYGAIPSIPPLDRNEISTGGEGGGLFIVGSHVPKSTLQLEHLLHQDGIQPIELKADRVLGNKSLAYIHGIVEEIDHSLSRDQTVALFTSRLLISGGDPDSSLEIGRTISGALVKVSELLQNNPAFIVAKGGITSHDIASRGLNIRRANVLGQALPGVPVLVPDHRPDQKYIVFPGNVGEEDSLSELYHKLRKQPVE